MVFLDVEATTINLLDNLRGVHQQMFNHIAAALVITRLLAAQLALLLITVDPHHKDMVRR